MKLSPKQFEIVKYLTLNGMQTKKQLIDSLHVKEWYYCNEDKHFGEVLSRLVKSGHIKREKKGLYNLNEVRKVKTKISDNQLDLFYY